MSHENTDTSGLSREALQRGFDLVVDESEAPPDLALALTREVESNLSGSVGEAREYYEEITGSTAEPSADALDPELFGRGGAAFLWEDVLSVGDAVKLLTPVLKGLPPDEAAKTLVGVAMFWRQLRGVRVMLNEQEFLVMRAVKRGKQNIQAIAEYTGLSASVVQSTVEELKARMYRSEIPLLEGVDGNLVTRF